MRSTLEREDFSRRLMEALARVGDDGSSPTRLAREFNRRYPGAPVTLHASRKWLNGEALPAQDKLRVLAEWLGVTPEWLRFGDSGDVRGTQRQAREAGQAVDFELARELGALSPAHREAVRALVKALRQGEASVRGGKAKRGKA
ncbi:hypothetical protein [Sulfuritalea sp.]|uniref:hypothetical protein n=1 Tax=Sulfuritalea sp. TaxID=2480090 RepID=UPI00286E8E02|nr:hypothetical protein [Sulfuritalea sp.]